MNHLATRPLVHKIGAFGGNRTLSSLDWQTRILPLNYKRDLVEPMRIERISDALQVLLAPLVHAVPCVGTSLASRCQNRWLASLCKLIYNFQRTMEGITSIKADTFR